MFKKYFYKFGHWFTGGIFKVDSEIQMNVTTNPEIDVTGGPFILRIKDAIVSSWAVVVNGLSVLLVDTSSNTITSLYDFYAPNILTKLFAQTVQGGAVTATSVETTVIGTGIGSLVIPANGFVVGDSFHAKVGGVISCVNSETIRIRIKSGSIVLADTGAISLSASSSKAWEMEMDFTIRVIGVATVANIISSGQFTYNKDSNNVYEGQGFNNLNSTTFDTTASNTLDVTVEWGSNNVGNSINSEVFALTKTY